MNTISLNTQISKIKIPQSFTDFLKSDTQNQIVVVGAAGN